MTYYRSTYVTTDTRSQLSRRAPTDADGRDASAIHSAAVYQGHRDGPEAFQHSFPLLEVSRRPADLLTEEHIV